MHDMPHTVPTSLDRSEPSGPLYLRSPHDVMETRLRGWGVARHAAAATALLDALFQDGYEVRPIAGAQPSYQDRVTEWIRECFGPEGQDVATRARRFLEEALEVVQSLGIPARDAHALVRYTFGRPPGEPSQELGGAALTLAGLSGALRFDHEALREAELARVWGKVEAIRAKQASKDEALGALPGGAPPDPLEGAILAAIAWHEARCRANPCVTLEDYALFDAHDQEFKRLRAAISEPPQVESSPDSPRGVRVEVIPRTLPEALGAPSGYPPRGEDST